MTYSFDHSYPEGAAGDVIFEMGETTGAVCELLTDDGRNVYDVIAEHGGILGQSTAPEFVDAFVFSDGTAILVASGIVGEFQQGNPDIKTACGKWVFDHVESPMGASHTIDGAWLERAFTVGLSAEKARAATRS